MVFNIIIDVRCIFDLSLYYATYLFAYLYNIHLCIPYI